MDAREVVMRIRQLEAQAAKLGEAVSVLNRKIYELKKQVTGDDSVTEVGDDADYVDGLG